MTAPLPLQIYVERIALFSDQEAFEKLYYHFRRKIYHFALAIVKSPEIAEEITSDVFMNCWKSRARLLEVENINLYMYVATKNLAIRQLSRDNKVKQFSIDDMDVDRLQSTYHNPEETLLNAELIRHLENAIRSLPPRCKLIYRMVKDDGLKYKEIAEILNISIKTIDAQMAIAARKISQSVCFVFPERAVK